MSDARAGAGAGPVAGLRTRARASSTCTRCRTRARPGRNSDREVGRAQALALRGRPGQSERESDVRLCNEETADGCADGARRDPRRFPDDPADSRGPGGRDARRAGRRCRAAGGFPRPLRPRRAAAGPVL